MLSLLLAAAVSVGPAVRVIELLPPIPAHDRITGERLAAAYWPPHAFVQRRKDDRRVMHATIRWTDRNGRQVIEQRVPIRFDADGWGELSLPLRATTTSFERLDRSIVEGAKFAIAFDTAGQPLPWSIAGEPIAPIATSATLVRDVKFLPQPPPPAPPPADYASDLAMWRFRQRAAPPLMPLSNVLSATIVDPSNRTFTLASGITRELAGIFDDPENFGAEDCNCTGAEYVFHIVSGGRTIELRYVQPQHIAISGDGERLLSRRGARQLDAFLRKALAK